jgi:hypothetical protein
MAESRSCRARLAMEIDGITMPDNHIKGSGIQGLFILLATSGASGQMVMLSANPESEMGFKAARRR